MIYTFAFVLLGLIASQAAALGGTCSSLAAEGEKSQDNFFPPAEAKVVGSGKLGLYEVPSTKCKVQKFYAMPGDYLTLYKLHESWAHAMFIAKNGEDVIAWVPKNRLKIVGQYGRNP